MNCIAFSFFFLDMPVFLYMRNINPHVLDFFRTITDFGLSGWILVPAALVTGIAYYVRRKVFSPTLKIALADIGMISSLVFVVISTTGLTAALLKQIIGRARPKLYDTLGSYDIDLFAFAHAQASFPSGHTTTIFAFAIVVSFYMPKLKVYMLSLASWVALSRVVTGAHYLSDIGAGALLGIAGALYIIVCAQRLGFVTTNTQYAQAGVRYGLVRLKRVVK